MKWCLSDKFDLKDAIPATLSTTLNCTGNQQQLFRLLKEDPGGMKINRAKNREDTPTNDDKSLLSYLSSTPSCHTCL